MRTFPNDYCSILVSDDSQIIFSGNQAVEGGGDVYGARLVDCLDINNNSVLRQGQPNETSWYFNIPQSHTMQFNNTDTLSSFSSDPIMVCFCESGFPNCSKRFLSHERLFPGQEVVTEIATVGNYGGTSSGTVSIAVHNATLVRPYGPQGTTAQCLKLHLLLESVNPTSASVAITVNGGLPEWGVTLVVDIIECPPGFHKNEQSGKCECAPILKNYSISCIIAHNASYFRRSGSNWFAFLNSSNRTCLIDMAVTISTHLQEWREHGVTCSASITDLHIKSSFLQVTEQEAAHHKWSKAHFYQLHQVLLDVET